MSEINLENPKEVIVFTKYVKFKIENIIIQKIGKDDTECSIQISLIDENGIYYGKKIELTKDEYSQWGDNDDYIINLVKLKISQL